ncbi:MAG: hypothetical protein A3G59_00945 [Candidatus Taylorbacteria bacterium RIFCSPLOWO2_12_FULL_47_20]|uniref:Methylated-DNA--protein-cysteine methyltransferase n=2 Tax=Candidatus Tayloriibacteriota TaxID=1817919 RepID=A0A1G2PBD4_9BACT|nr:MAG: hypothetical protein A3H68_00980 [Candidatus Taylorbacteria bacterium RIFCSPLOWO2_02_FULL_46_40]OHA45657.1 MAG: hypothetical protein A3G59_00945 [Candidatus Taylorbacteria bacterium RIFCSPLOWO2_12_FULL_47_20]
MVCKIPSGATLSYSEVASRAGNPPAARVVGAILKTNHDPKIPCHRVICKNGKIGGYNRGVVLKKARLKEEQRLSRV